MINKVLVSGGVGFLGTNLCLRLLSEGYSVIALDNFNTGQRENLELLSKNSNFEFIEHDIINPIDLKADFIFNLACPASPPRYQKDEVYTTKTNVLGSLNMLEVAKANNAPIMQASTSEIYGDPLAHPQTEDYRGNVNTIGIRACYDEGKRCAESLFYSYKRQHGVDVRVVRIFNTYGPYMDPLDGRVVSNFIISALKGEPLEIYGDGGQTRSFCYVDDMIDAFMATMKSDGFDEPINLGNPDEFTVGQLAEKILLLSKSSSSIIYKDLPQDDPTRRRPDITRAKNILKWSLSVKIDTGLESTIKYFSEKV